MMVKDNKGCMMVKDNKGCMMVVGSLQTHGVIVPDYNTVVPSTSHRTTPIDGVCEVTVAL